MKKVEHLSPEMISGRSRSIPKRRVHKVMHLHPEGLKGKLRIARNPLIPRALRGK
ncbi:MAG: hypothetical protein OEY64_06890 [Nitrospinota bacterium]|nr:hypothetical protein [Nitrospinota bacterium]